MGHHHNSHHHHHATAADGGMSQRVNSSRFSDPMTRRAHSFKHNNKKSSQNTHNTSSSANNGGSLNSHHEIIDLQLNSPRSESPVSGYGPESLGERRPVHVSSVAVKGRARILPFRTQSNSVYQLPAISNSDLTPPVSSSPANCSDELGPGLYSDIGKRARDLFYRDHLSDQKFTVTTYSQTGVVNNLLVRKNLSILTLTSSRTKKGDIILADINTQSKHKNITTDVKVDTSSNLFTTVTVEELALGMKAILSFRVADQRSRKLEVQYLHNYAGISSCDGLTANPIVNFSGVVGNNTLTLGSDLSFDTRGALSKCNFRASFTNVDFIASLTL
ncbi:Porin/voltage-dependent anion-selective channel protein [Forsythia ovata]|uniref:Porin/voltage-dependent anion-selective channel protein n=1 Tax=Forsythia ovata TaxID=205694 RepID=A0ABD1WRQ9_9LAMI